MAGYNAKIQRLHDLGILVQQGQAPQPGVTIPDHYKPDYISEELASQLLRLSKSMEAARRPLNTLWSHDGVLEWPMRNQHVFSLIQRPHIRPQVTNYAITRLDVEVRIRNDGSVIMPAKKFWALVALEVVLLAIYALFCDG
ncbi:hypothetical protein DHEL01_v212912 [Diaporthe helianthi]|uniref:Uncharacterized protein n=1 Tax=Diaporthe helianthi TaxID=158607 RepID=A0A2P5HEL7_DIAHE|nr:hypothetical protein DHEL01_v212912 [Diaporthe helianthi]